jgi:acyl-CoA synthetase (AMP-forming)/AMP-acid ligase II
VTTASTIPAQLAATTDQHGDRVAIVDGDVRLTYAALRDAARDFGAALVHGGIAPGNRVSIWMPNCVEWVIAVLGIWSAGATLVPINTRFKGGEASEILGRSRCRLLVTVSDFLGTDYAAMLHDSGAELPDLETIVVARSAGWHDFVGAATETDRAELDRRAAAVDAADVSDILFTSGTTGTPKGVVQTHRSTLGVAGDWVAMTGLGPDDRYLMVNPYFHMFGLKAGILASLIARATMLPEPVFDVARVLRRVVDERVTVLPGAPTLYQSILDHPDRDAHDLSTLRLAVTGAADIPVELIRRTMQELPFRTVIAGYGLTEGGTATATEPDDPPEAVATTVGKPRPGFELRIVDGEIHLRGATVMSHYLDDPEATAAVLSPDGWLRTGDLGVIDDAGRLKIIGRSKDMFIVGGFNAYPAEIENALLKHPDIQQVAVIGIPDDRLGEVGMAFVVPHPGATATADDLIEWSRHEMANYKVPRRVEFVTELPVNATGKVVKDELRKRV